MAVNGNAGAPRWYVKRCPAYSAVAVIQANPAYGKVGTVGIAAVKPSTKVGGSAMGRRRRGIGVGGGGTEPR